MANPTTNYGWPMPTSTDLVTDLPADFDAFGQPVDNTLKALNPETTLGDISYRSAVSNTNTRLGIGTAGQVLAVSGGVPAWTTTADVTPLTTKGDLFTFTTEDARIGVGADGTVLTAASGEATGLQWAAPAAAGFVGCALYRTTNLTTSNDVDIAVQWDSETFDTDGFHSTATNTSRITIPSGKGGYYYINGQLSYANDIDGDRITFIKKNGSTFNYLMVLTPSNATYGNSTNASIIMNLTAGDYIELFSNQRSGGNLTVYSGSQNSTFSCAYLGA
jgi:hypothetical protein